MVGVSEFKFVFGATDVVHCFAIIRANGRPIHDSACATLTIHWTLLPAAVAGFRCNLSVFAQVSIVAVDNGFHIWSATVTDFNCISIEDFAVLVVRRKVLGDES